jgi:hypothetical protein
MLILYGIYSMYDNLDVVGLWYFPEAIRLYGLRSKEFTYGVFDASRGVTGQLMTFKYCVFKVNRVQNWYTYVAGVWWVLSCRLINFKKWRCAVYFVDRWGSNNNLCARPKRLDALHESGIAVSATFSDSGRNSEFRCWSKSISTWSGCIVNASSKFAFLWG